MLVTILTSSNIRKLHRCVRSLENQTVKSFKYQIVVNTLNKNYEKQVLAEYPQAIITESNGTPGKGKNSVVSLWKKDTEHEFFSLIDGDDFVHPNFIEVLQEHIALYPDIDYLGGCGTECINEDYTAHCWETSDRDPRSEENSHPIYFRDTDILAPDRLALVSKKCLPYVMFFEEFMVYEDLLLSLKLTQLFRSSIINYYITTSCDLYVYDRSSENSITSINSDWAENIKKAKRFSTYVCHYGWSSNKDIPLIKVDEKRTHEERRLYIEDNIIYPVQCFTYGTDINKCSVLLNSAQRYGYPIFVQGNGEEYKGHGQKIIALKDFCEAQDPEDIILFMDAYDTCFVRPAQEFFKELESWDLEERVVFNAEKNAWPDPELMLPFYRKKYPESDYKFLNSGLILGKAKNILKLIPENPPLTFDDQRYYALLDIEGEESSIIYLDYNCVLFNPLSYGVKDIGWDGEKFYNKLTNTNPFVLHANFGLYAEETLQTFYSLTTLINIPMDASAIVK